MPKNYHYVFVYGTLKEGYYNHELLKDSEFIACAKTKDKYPMVNTEEYFPYLINDKGYGYHIEGEVYRVNQLTLLALDQLEGYPELYTREQIKIISGGIELSAIVYFVKEDINYESFELLEVF
jgi:gamma-glutamylcyclotransferase (GGCT)/AIG2-like uncharacterized protein YtfP